VDRKGGARSQGKNSSKPFGAKRRVNFYQEIFFLKSENLLVIFLSQQSVQKITNLKPRKAGFKIVFRRREEDLEDYDNSTLPKTLSRPLALKKKVTRPERRQPTAMRPWASPTPTHSP
jgi:hypothetical protein